MKQIKMSAKDLVYAGLFSFLTMVGLFVGGMIGFIPVLMPIVPFVGGLLSGPIFMLYCRKVPKRNMFYILAFLVMFLFVVTGHGYYILVPGIPLAIFGEFYMRKGNYTNQRNNKISYSLFLLCLGGNLYPLYFLRDQWIIDAANQGYSQDFTSAMLSVLPDWSFLPITILGAIGGYLGCCLGEKLIHKHFETSGLVKK